MAELYQGELLFATHDNIEHLALIEKTVGKFPLRMLKRAKNKDIVRKAFDSNGRHRVGQVLSVESMEFVEQTIPMEALVKRVDIWLSQLLRKLLVIDPDGRATARHCLKKFSVR